MNIWDLADGAKAIQPISGTLLRLVESQEQIASTRLVGLENQVLLEEMLEAVKPAFPKSDRGLHYLLSTPFRYPPLQHGSRFGTRSEPSLFYGGLSLQTTLAEAAYYRFVFWKGMAVPPSASYLTQHTLFNAPYSTQRGLKLQAMPFAAYLTQLSHPNDYSATQQLGAVMRKAGIEAFEYVSARDVGKGLNVALYTPSALADIRPGLFEEWLCETNGNAVQFASRDGQHFLFRYTGFLVEGTFPQPA